QIFVPRIEKNKTINSYMDLIYGSLLQDNILENIEDDDNSNSISNDDDILTAENKYHLKYTY
ncbi:10526_t:CDS:1, partial [Scutellospora calospora]